MVDWNLSNEDEFSVEEQRKFNSLENGNCHSANDLIENDLWDVSIEESKGKYYNAFFNSPGILMYQRFGLVYAYAWLYKQYKQEVKDYESPYSDDAIKRMIIPYYICEELKRPFGDVVAYESFEGLMIKRTNASSPYPSNLGITEEDIEHLLDVVKITGLNTDLIDVSFCGTDGNFGFLETIDNDSYRVRGKEVTFSAKVAYDECRFFHGAIAKRKEEFDKESYLFNALDLKRKQIRAMTVYLYSRINDLDSETVFQKAYKKYGEDINRFKEMDLDEARESLSGIRMYLVGYDDFEKEAYEYLVNK